MKKPYSDFECGNCGYPTDQSWVRITLPGIEEEDIRDIYWRCPECGTMQHETELQLTGEVTEE